MHVIGAGFGRTGTQTLQNALNALGYNCFHTKELVSATPSFVLLWDELGDRMLDWETTEKKVASISSHNTATIAGEHPNAVRGRPSLDAGTYGLDKHSLLGRTLI